MLLLHNIEDDNVLFCNSLQMQNALQEAGKHYELVIYPQKFARGGRQGRGNHLQAELVRFFDEALK